MYAYLLFMNVVKKLDAAMIFVFLYESLGDLPGTVEGTSFEKTAVALNAAGLTTGRGGAFTAAIVRSNLKYLEELGLIERFGVGSSVFDLRLKESFARLEPRPAPTVDVYGGKTLFDGVENDYENENENRSERRGAKEEYINTKTNKQTNEPKSFVSKNGDEQLDPQATSAPVATVNEVVSRFDFSQDVPRRFRAVILKDLYDVGLRADLVDRAMVAVWKRYATIDDLKAALRVAKDEVRVRETTNGFKGRRFIWETFAPIVKSWYDSAGIVWTPTSPRLERRPVYSAPQIPG